MQKDFILFLFLLSFFFYINSAFTGNVLVLNWIFLASCYCFFLPQMNECVCPILWCTEDSKGLRREEDFLPEDNCVRAW